MGKLLSILASVVLSLVLSMDASAGEQLIVRFRKNSSPNSWSTALSKAPQSRVLNEIRPRNVRRAAATRGPLLLVDVPAGMSGEKYAVELQNSPEVLYVEPNLRLRVCAAPVPNDFEFQRQYSLSNKGSTNTVAGADIHALDAWAVTTGDSRLLAAVIDTGIDYFHEDLAANIWTNPGEIPGNGIDDDGNGFIDDVHGFDFVSGDGDPLDDNLHGTHVAGIIGAIGNNGSGIAGVCWKLQMMAVKAFNEKGQGDTADAINGIAYAVNNGARVINASWGIDQRSKAMEEAVEDAVNAGALFVAAAGNNHTSARFYPAAFPGVIAVAATDASDHRAVFSNYGAYVTLAAPGDQIFSTVLNNGYDYESGTSMASPHVAGLACLILSHHPEMRASDVAAIIINTCDPLTTDQPIGAGRINAARALQVEHPLPIARLDQPSTLAGEMRLTGDASGESFRSYTLSYNSSANPKSWTNFASGAERVVAGVLNPPFDSTTLPDGDWNLRLSVEDLFGQTASSVVKVRIRNTEITSPLSADILLAGAPIEIMGSAFGNGVTFGLEWAAGLVPGEWKSGGFTKSATTPTGLLRQRLAVWDSKAAPAREFISFRLLSTNLSGGVREFRTPITYLEANMESGWPQYVPLDADFPLDEWRQIQITDLDQDGRKEVILLDPGTDAGKPARLMTWNAEGRLLWTRTLTNGPPLTDIPAIGDVNGDGAPEIFTDIGNKLFAIRADGTDLPGKWPVTLKGTHLGKTLGDVDGDGQPELVTLSNDPLERTSGNIRVVTVFGREGQALQKWSVPWCEITNNLPAIPPLLVNLDDDPAFEIVVPSNCGDLVAFKFGNPDPLWTVATATSISAPPVAADFFGSGKMNILLAGTLGNGASQGGLYLFDHNGAVLRGWPVLTDHSFIVPPAIGRFSQGASPLIAIPSFSGFVIHLLNSDGFEVTGWPVSMDNSTIRCSPVIGDITGDGVPEIIAATPGFMNTASRQNEPKYVGGLKAWKLDGSPVKFNGDASRYEALPMESTNARDRNKGAAPVLADLDGDGKLEVVAASIIDKTNYPLGQTSDSKNRSSIYVWSFDVPVTFDSIQWSGYQGGASHSGVLPSPKRGEPPPVLGEIPAQTIPAGGSFRDIPLDGYLTSGPADAATLHWQAAGQASLQVAISQDHVATILPLIPNWEGREQVTFTVTDPLGRSSSATTIFRAQAGYQPPSILKDAGQTMEDTATLFDVLANDVSVGGGLRLKGVSQPAHGFAEVIENKVRYLPATNYFGADAFTYEAEDDEGNNGLAEVIITVLPVNDAPIAATDRAITTESTPVSLHLLANDLDPDDEPIQLISHTAPTNGVVVLSSDGSGTYTPTNGFHGVDSFRYTLSDPLGLTGEGSVEILVKPVNNAPTVTNRSFTLNRNTSVDVTYTAEDLDADDLTYRVEKGPDHGELESYPTLGTYRPKKGFSGTDSFTYIASDGLAESPAAVISLTVLNTNNPPVATSIKKSSKPNRPLSIVLQATDPDDDPLTFKTTKDPEHGSLSIGPTNEWTYTPAKDFVGSDLFSFAASDGSVQSLPAEVEITVTTSNTPPVALARTIRCQTNSSVAFKLSGRDDESDPLSFRLEDLPIHGSVTGAPPDLVYTPANGFKGSDRFTFVALDGETTSTPASITLVVKPANEAPKSTNQQLSLRTSQQAIIKLRVGDADGNELQCPILKGPRHGVLSGSGSTYKYVAEAGYRGSDSFTYKPWDGLEFGPEARVTIIISTNPEGLLPFITDARIAPDGGVTLVLQFHPGSTARLEYSTNLVDWELLTELTSADGHAFFVDRPSTETRFYRAAE